MPIWCLVTDTTRRTVVPDIGTCLCCCAANATTSGSTVRSSIPARRASSCMDKRQTGFFSPFLLFFVSYASLLVVVAARISFLHSQFRMD